LQRDSSVFQQNFQEGIKIGRVNSQMMRKEGGKEEEKEEENNKEEGEQ